MKLENVHEVKKILGEENRPKDGTSGKLQESRADEEQKLTGPEKMCVLPRRRLGSFTSFKPWLLHICLNTEILLPRVTTTSVRTQSQLNCLSPSAIKTTSEKDTNFRFLMKAGKNWSKKMLPCIFIRLYYFVTPLSWCHDLRIPVL